MRLLATLLVMSFVATNPVLAEPAPAALRVWLPSSLPTRKPPEWLSQLQMPDGMPIRMDRRVVDYLVHFHDEPRGQARIRAWFERGRAFEALIREILRAHQLPEELFYVAMVESGFDLSARSRARAVGLWQFVSRSAKEYGLERTRSGDERMDAVRSSHAAARYLRDLHQRFGTWELAIAGFNMGAGALLRSIRKYNSNDYALLSRIEAGLPYETVYYVARIMACAIVGANRAAFGIEPPAEADAVGLAAFPARTSLVKVARAAKISLKTLREYNPALRSHRTPTSRAVTYLRLPAANLQELRANWRGELLDAETFATDSELLAMAAGKAAPRAYRIQPPHAHSLVRAHPEGLLAAVPSRTRSDNDKPMFFLVNRPMPAQALARHLRVSVDSLQRWNHIDIEARLQADMLVQVFFNQVPQRLRDQLLSPEHVALCVVGGKRFFHHHESARERRRIVYTAKRGDTLRSLARRFDLTTASLARINRISRRSDLQPGQQIVVYAPN